jgi:hypothetical protein
MELNEESMNKLRNIFGGIEDKRRHSGNYRHLLIDILVIGYIAILCGFSDFADMEQFGREKEAWFKRFLELPHGIPDENTFKRVFRWVKPEGLREALEKWFLGAGGKAGKIVNIDGKTARGSADENDTPARHIVGAWVGERNLTLGQVTVGRKARGVVILVCELAVQ